MSTVQSPLSRYREKAKLSLAALASQFGVNKTTIMRWEDGKVPAERVLEVERATGVSRYELRPDIYPAPRNRRRPATEQVAA